MREDNSQRGQALIEFALVLPLLFLLILNVVNFGGLLYAVITVAHAARSGVQYQVTRASYLGSGSPNGLASIATPTKVQNLLTNCSSTPRGDLCSLPNQANITVAVCSNNASSSTATPQFPETCLPPNDPATAGAPFQDPESGTSVVGTVTVNYRYCPFIPFWDFPNLGVHLTLPACSTTAGVTTGGFQVRRVGVMRMIQ